MGPRYNVQSTEGPLRYPTPPELVLLYNAKRGTVVFAGAKIVPDERNSHQKGDPTGTSGTPPEHLRNTTGKPPQNPARGPLSPEVIPPPGASFPSLPKADAHARGCQLVF